MAKEQQRDAAAGGDKEGPRSFGVFLNKMADGAAERELSAELFALTKTIKEEARVRGDKVKGGLTLKLSFEVEGDDGVVKVAYDIAAKAPKPQRRNGHFWFTQGGNLTAEAPKQSKLPFQDVADRRGMPRDLGGDQPAKEA